MNIDFRYKQPLMLKVSQYDYGYSLDVGIWNAGMPVTISTASIVGENFTEDCTASGNIISVPITASMTSQFGQFAAELKVTDSVGTMYTQNFLLCVERSPIQFGASQEVSGATAQFVVNGRVPLDSVIVDINPQQDLNGYDKPWPPGGGKNLFDGVLEQGTFTSDGLNSSALLTRVRSKNYILVTPGATYTITKPQGYGVSASFYSVNDYTTPRLSYTNFDYNPTVTISIPEDAYYIRLLFAKRNAELIPSDVTDVQVELGSTATTYAPYSNICPITGWTACNITRVGKNLFDAAASTAKKYINSSGAVSISNNWAVSDYTTIKGGLTYTLSGIRNTGAVAYHAFYDAEKKFISSILSTVMTFAAPDNAMFVRLSLNTETPTEVQLEIGDTATTFEVFKGITTYTINWQTEAGTVYGGELDVTTGVLTVTRGVLTLNTANMNNSETYPGWKNCGIGDLIGAGVNAAIDDVLLNIGTALSANTVNYSSSNSGTAFLPRAVYGKTQTEWITLAIDVQMCIPLATPLTYQLTPTEITSLLGQNVVWADTGDVSVEYREVSA